MGMYAELQQRARAGARVARIVAQYERVERARQVEAGTALPVAAVGEPETKRVPGEAARFTGRPDVA